MADDKVPFEFKIRDDFGLKRAALCYQVFRPKAGGALEAREKGELPVSLEAGAKSLSGSLLWDLSRLVPTLTTGSSITCWIEAEDARPRKERGTSQKRGKDHPDRFRGAKTYGTSRTPRGACHGSGSP